MTQPRPPLAPQLKPAQMAWLQEIGIDKRLLLPFMARTPHKAVATGSTVGSTVTDPSHSPTTQVSARVAPRPDAVRPLAVAPVKAGLVSAAALLKDAAVSVKGTSSVGTAIPTEWAALRSHVAACESCSLYAGRSQTVFGAGVTESVQWLVVGEAPGDRDDSSGLPFQGTAGHLLNTMLAAAGVQTETSVFYTNLLKCRPRGSRTPTPEEIASCMPYLQRQIALLKPQRILALGRLAAQALLENDTEFEQLRGQVHVFRSEAGVQIPLVVTYHPASLLSRPRHKANAWRDLLLAGGSA